MSLAVLCLLNPESSWPTGAEQQVGVSTRHEASATTASPLVIEFSARQKKLDAAKQSGDPAAIVATSRLVIASALHQIGRLKFMEGAVPEAIEIYRRSIDFEDSPDARVDLSAAEVAASPTPTHRESTKA